MFGTKSTDGYHEVLKGIKLKTLVHGKETLMTEFVMDKGAELPLHGHVYEQTGYLVKGKIKLHIGDAFRTISPGESWCIPSNIQHKADILEDSVAVEVFSPLRVEYQKYMNTKDVAS
jgi:quercetin dioxygenase-like cupin family protein